MTDTAQPTDEQGYEDRGRKDAQGGEPHAVFTGMVDPAFVRAYERGWADGQANPKKAKKS